MNSQETLPENRAGTRMVAGASRIASNVVPAHCWPGWVELGKWGDFTRRKICRRQVWRGRGALGALQEATRCERVFR